MGTPRFRFTVFFCLCFFAAKAQNDFSVKTWRFIDTSIINKRSLTDLLQTVKSLEKKAWEEKKYLYAARCLQYQVLIADQKTEDTFYFKNSAILNEWMARPETPPVFQYAMNMLLAARLRNFSNRYNRFERVLYSRKDIPVNYAAYKNDGLDSIAQTHFEKAKALAKTLVNENIDEALWLSADPLQFLFKPGLFDIAIAEQIESVKRSNLYNTKLKEAMLKWIGQPADIFISTIDSAGNKAKNISPDLKRYCEWLAYHSSDPAIYYFIETLARKYVYGLAESYQNGEKEYESYLLDISASPYKPVRAHGVYQLCLLWNEQSERYFPGSDRMWDSRQRIYTIEKRNFDTAYRYHAVKALRLFQDNKNLLDSFYYLKEVLLEMEAGIRKTDFLLTLQGKNLPDQPLLAELKFRNTDTIHYRIVHCTPYDKKTFGRKKDVINYLLKQRLQIEAIAPLPHQDDYNYHNTYLQLEALPPGNYAMVVSPKPLSDTSYTKDYFFFGVTRIAAINSDKRVYVLDRKTGMPLTGAKVQAVYEEEIRSAKDTTVRRSYKYYTVNSRGYVEIADRRYDELNIVMGNDTVTEFVNYHAPDDEPDNVYSKDDYEDLVEYYEGNAQAHIYTDRSIYRPGQTVHFKAIFLTTHPKTGKAMLMNRENLKGKLFGSVYKKWLRSEEPILYIKDPFDKEMDSLKIIPNSYGSVSGSFKIPKTAATGEWNIEPDYIDKDWDNGKFRVEEYKRPSYEVETEKPEKEIKPGDEFSFKVKVKSFAGASLNSVQVDYKIFRSSYYKYGSPLYAERNNRTDTIIVSRGFTDQDGELEVKVKDSAIFNDPLVKESWTRFNYEISAEVKDATGESYETGNDLTISARPLSIHIPLDRVNKRSNIDTVSVSTTDENAGNVYKTVQVKIYRTVREQRLLSDRDLIKSDLWLYDSTVLQQQFPNEKILQREPEEKKELMLEQTIITSDSSRLGLNPSLFPAGEYELEAVCIEKGDTTGEMTRSFSVFDDKENKLPRTEWAFDNMQYNSAKPGDELEYYSGSAAGETYSIYHISYFSNGKKVRSVYTYDEKLLPKGLSRYGLKVPADGVEKMELTRLFILNNQLFSHEETVYIETPAKPEPEIIVEKYRKKLSPGSKETFSVSVKTKNINTAAELMTTMYDASLDKLEEHNWEKPDVNDEDNYFNNSWTTKINAVTRNGGRYYYTGINLPEHASKRIKALWWLNPLDYAYGDEDVMGDWNNIPGRRGEEMANGYNDYGAFRGNNYNIRREMGGYALFAPRFDRDQLELSAGYGGGVGLTGTTGVPFLRIGNQGLFGIKSNLQFSANFNTLANFSMDNTVKLNFAGKTLLSTNGLYFSGGDDVVALSAKALGASVITVRGNTSITSYAQPLIILDGVVFTGDINSIDSKSIKSGLVLKGADAVAIYGAQAINGVLILSTTGDILLPVEPEPVMPARKNFNESAFFFPAIYADKEGYFTFTFTMPESVTKWNWKMLAHTGSAAFAYAEKTLNTQLPLMVQPNIPRLLYQGDSILLQSRITNLDTINVSGKITWKVENADDIRPDDAREAALYQEEFTVEKKSNIAVPFKMKVPAGQTAPLKITVTVRSENFADGEEHIIPILSPKVFVKNSQVFRFEKTNDTTLSIPPLPAGAELYGIGLSLQPQPRAALINSLPFLAGYPYGCAEQTFNKLMAYAVACKLLRKDTLLQQSFEQARTSLEKDNRTEKLPAELADETMPWMGLSGETIHRQQKLFDILDTSKTKPQIEELLQKIYKMQGADGGIAWFPGGKSNYYISTYLLRGFGKLKAGDMLVTGLMQNSHHDQFIKKIIGYADAAFTAEMKNEYWRDALDYAYARSYWLSQYPVTDSIKNFTRERLLEELKKTGKTSLYKQALLVITAIRYAASEQDELYSKAKALLLSIKQSAIEDRQYGMRWKDMADDDDLTTSAEETTGLLAEAFAEAKDNDAVTKIIQWLLMAKGEHNWQTTKGTAAAINALLKDNDKKLTLKQSAELWTDKTKISAGNDLLSGRSFDFAKASAVPAAVRIQKSQPGEASGHVYQYYFTSGEGLTALNKEVQLEKRFYKWNSNENKWEEIKQGERLKIADKIKATITIQSQKALPFVFIDDKRAALFEPASNSSGYEYEGGLSYYRSVRDAGFRSFMDNIPSGKHELSYEMKVAQEGVFFSGPAVLQCMYKPEVTAYSNSMNFVSGK